MILSNDKKSELMIDLQTGRMFKRPLTNEELKSVEKEEKRALFEKIDNLFETAEEKLEALTEAGFDLLEIFDMAMEA